MIITMEDINNGGDKESKLNKCSNGKESNLDNSNLFVKYLIICTIYSFFFSFFHLFCASKIYSN